MLSEISVKAIVAVRGNLGDGFYGVGGPGLFNGLPIGLGLASADVHFPNICQGLNLV